ncbi:AMP-binding protein [Streptomyces sp. ML-6]|uniref:AMP-binding protein n=1 Tax=Streptomyces sp. ML-6 TaxID=2982693 RepID=UPI0024BF9220|nr:AMP-binding protein [Streptomyces sp. ML-6]MDK0517994.1 AMP-binding protein [Streptomyces sp. ML-6]
MAVEALRRPDSEAYWLVLAYALPEWAGPEEARAAWQETVRANPALRTRIYLDGSGPFQVIEPEGPALREVPPGEPGRGADFALWCRARSAELRGRFLQEPLRAHYVPGVPGDAHTGDPALVVISHHALMDGWSMEQCMGDFHRRLAAPGEPLTERASGAGYLSWLETAGVLEKCRKFWAEQMRGAEPAPELPFTKRRESPGADDHPDPRSCEKELSRDAARGLSRFARRNGLTRAAVFTTLWMHILRQYQEHPDVSIGLTVNNRPAAALPGIGEASGFLLNTLPLRLELSDDFAADCARVQERTVTVTEHAHLPYSEVVEATGLPGMTRLFTSTLVFQNFRRAAGAAAAPMRPVLALGSSADELSLTVDLEADGVKIELAWDAELYGRTAVEALVRDLEHWLARLEEVDPTAGLVTPLDLSHGLSGTAAPPRPWCPGRLLEAAEPDRIAVAHGTGTLTYAELRRRAAALADRLVTEHGVGPGDAVALVGGRGIGAVVAMCAVWSLGAAWCPVDPSWPAERRERVLRSLRPRAVVALADTDGPTAPGRAPDPEHVRRLTAHTMPPDAVAYYVPTSGSTGTPRLAVLSAGGLQPVIDAWLTRYGLAGTGQRILQFGSWTSDVFLGDVLKTLATGGTLVICPDEARVDLEQVEELVRRWRITLLESTPVVVAALVRRLARSRTPPAELTTLIVGADTFRVHEAEETVALLWEGATLYNGYGLSEGTVESLVQECRPGLDSRSGLCPIGRPLPGTGIAVLDARGRPLPYGAVGELVITGAQVGLGYLTEEGLCAADRFTTAQGVRSFRTGDLVRFGDGGRLEFHGRRDGLTKIRGHRVELGEVEDCLLRLPGVEEAFAFLADRALQPELVAFVGGSGIDERTVRERLLRMLPEYAVPGRIVVEHALPRGDGGKLDRVLMRGRAIGSGPVRADTPVRAGDDLAARLTDLWSEVLERPVSPDRSFFDQGGNSILAMTLHARMGELLPEHEFPIAQLFAHPTITAFCESLRASRPPSEGPADRSSPTGELEVLKALERGELDIRAAMRLLRENLGDRP